MTRIYNWKVTNLICYFLNFQNIQKEGLRKIKLYHFFLAENLYTNIKYSYDDADDNNSAIIKYNPLICSVVT